MNEISLVHLTYRKANKLEMRERSKVKGSEVKGQRSKYTHSATI